MYDMMRACKVLNFYICISLLTEVETLQSCCFFIMYLFSFDQGFIFFVFFGKNMAQLHVEGNKLLKGDEKRWVNAYFPPN